jgi:hypothetical protein
VAAMRRSTPEELARGATEFEMAVVKNEVVLRFPQPTELVVFGAENARQIAESLARYAYQAHTGKELSDADIQSQIAQDIRDRLTDQLRDRMIARFALVVPSMLEKLKGSATPGRIAMELVDILLREVTQ